MKHQASNHENLTSNHGDCHLHHQSIMKNLASNHADRHMYYSGIIKQLPSDRVSPPSNIEAPGQQPWDTWPATMRHLTINHRHLISNHEAPGQQP
jgi:hypothetical protein